MSDLHETTLLAQTNMVRDGISLPEIVNGVTIPSDYSMIPNMGEGNIGDLMGQLASQLEFLEYQNSLAEVDYEAWSTHFESEKKKIMLTLESERKDMMEAKAESQLEGLKRVVQEKYAKRILLKSILDGRKRILDTLSRELSRRSLVSQSMRMAGQFNP